jgi:Undecaprenyl-phosphate galactose phosphotransferase WbaP
MKHRVTKLLIVTDVLAFALAFALSQTLRLSDFGGLAQGRDALLAWWQYEGQFRARAASVVVLGALVIFGWFRLHYTQRKPFWDELREVLNVLILLAFFDAAMLFFNKWQFSRLAFGLFWCLVLVLVPLLRSLLKIALLRRGLWQTPVCLVGSGDNAREAWLALRSESMMGYELAQVILPPGDRAPDWARVPCINWQDFSSPFPGQADAQLVVAVEADQQDVIDHVLRHAIKSSPSLLIVPAARGLPLLGMESLHSFSHEVLLLRAHNNLLRGSSRFIKRSFDITVALLLLILCLPLFTVLALQIRRSGGPAFFGHSRIGHQGRAFPCYKFRTMVPNSAEVLEALLSHDANARAEWEREFKLRNDPRITPVGAFLRRTSLDELPQLWNVLRGDMSLVGPRPVIGEELARYGDDASYYLQVRPGMTGLWQVSGRNNVDYGTRVALDAWYVRNWSLWNDIVILVKTVRVVLAREGAY